MLQILAPERVQPGRALEPLADHPGLTEDLEVVSARRFDDREVEAPARPLRADGQAADDQEPHRIAQRV